MAAVQNNFSSINKLIAMDVFDKLYIVRKLISLNQKDAAEKSGLKQSTISTLERGDKNSLPSNYINFLYQNGIDLNWIFSSDSDIANAFRKTQTTTETAIDKISHDYENNGENEKRLDSIFEKLLQGIEKLNATLSMKL